MTENKIKLSDTLLSSKDVMQKLQITRKTLSKYTRAKKIIPIKVSERKFLYDAQHIEDFINKAKFGK